MPCWSAWPIELVESADRLRPLSHLVAQLPQDPGGPADIRFAERGAHGRGDGHEPGAQLAVAHVTPWRELHELRTPVLRVVDESDKPLSRKLVRQPLHPLAAGGPHLGDLRHGQRTKHCEASHEAERTAAPAGDQPGFLADGAYSEETLGHFEHQLGNCCRLPVRDWACLSSRGRFAPVSCRRHRARPS
jgi:hypothetical protein